jgi:hypothetical protein
MMSRQLLVRILLCFVPFLLQACGSQGDTINSMGGTIAAGGTIATGGATASGGAMVAGGTTTSSGGATMASGGTTTAAGGTTTSGGAAASGGASTARGGSTTTSGGATTAGGIAALSGGNTSSKGGSVTPSGGSPTAAGGATSSTGGASATGGIASGTGGTSARGGTSATGGATATGGTSATTGTSAPASEVWVSPTGSDTNPGTQSQPMLNICIDDSTTGTKGGACYKLCPAGAGCPTTGGTIWVTGGTYKLSNPVKLGSSKNGNASAALNVTAVADATPEGANPAILDFSGLARASSCSGASSSGGTVGITVNGNYWHISGLTVIHASDNGIKVQGGNDILENCVAHDNDDFGIALGHLSSSGTPVAGAGSNNQFINCDSYHNVDKICSGESADGFGAKKNSGTGNVFKGCRSWSNSDDGYDFYGWTDSITLQNCWAFNMATESAYSGSNSDGNGFKLGSSGGDGGHKLTSCIAFGNKATGFTSNSGASSSCTGCKSCNNGKADTGVSGVTSGGCPSSAAAQMKRASDGSLPSI